VKKKKKEKENDKWLRIGRQQMRVPKARVSSTLSLKGRKCMKPEALQHTKPSVEVNECHPQHVCSTLNLLLAKGNVFLSLFALTQFGLNHSFVCALPTEAERVVGWARNHHLGLCLSDPPTNKGKLIIPQNRLSLQFHFSGYKLCL
jgi:hypothetical protein